jgi:septum site-determining protein MinC
MITRNEEKPSVWLKGVGDSLWVSLDPTQSYELLKEDLERAFERLKHVAINARVILDPGEEENHKELIDSLGAFLKEKFDVRSVSSPAKKRSPAEEHVRQQDLDQSWRHHRSDALVISGRVRSGQKITARKHLVLLGDVNPGGEVVAGGDILILGSLCGTAAAGQPDNDQSIVLALEFRPIQIQIGGVVAAGLPPPSGGATLEFARVENGTILVEDYVKANPFGKLPWPEVR